jgi:hypothetical protein
VNWKTAIGTSLQMQAFGFQYTTPQGADLCRVSKTFGEFC